MIGHRKDTLRSGQAVDLHPKGNESTKKDQADKARKEITGNLVGRTQGALAPKGIGERAAQPAMTRHPRIKTFRCDPERRKFPIELRRPLSIAATSGQRLQCGTRTRGQAAVRAGQDNPGKGNTPGGGNHIGRCRLQGPIFHRAGGVRLPAVDPAPAKIAIRVPIEHGFALCLLRVHVGQQACNGVGSKSSRPGPVSGGHPPPLPTKEALPIAHAT